jgi:hypothetical protein
MPEQKRTYIDPNTQQWVTEESGRTRPATEEEIQETVEEWSQQEKEGEQDADRWRG